MSALFWQLKALKTTKFQIFANGHFFLMDSPMDMIFGVFSETIVRLLKNIILQFFSKYSKSCNILNAKSCSKLKGS